MCSRKQHIVSRARDFEDQVGTQDQKYVFENVKQKYINSILILVEKQSFQENKFYKICFPLKLKFEKSLEALLVKNCLNYD